MSDETRPGEPVGGPPAADAADGGEESVEIDLRFSEDDDPLRREIATLQDEVVRLKELYLRKLADFENYRKRQERDLAEFRRFANSELVRDSLPVVDNLERAVAVSGSDAGGGLRAGVELVLKQFRDVLGRHGLVEIDPAGAAFDPAEHEAIARQESAAVSEATVVQVLQKGYRLHERLMRPALVTVAVPSPQPASGGEGGHGQDHRD